MLNPINTIRIRILFLAKNSNIERIRKGKNLKFISKISSSLVNESSNFWKL